MYFFLENAKEGDDLEKSYRTTIKTEISDPG